MIFVAGFPDFGFHLVHRSQKEWFSLRALRALRSIVVCLAVLAGTPASAHDLEHTQVLVTFARDGSFIVDVANDPAWLKLRLEPFTGSFADRVVLWVDGQEIRPTSVEYLPASAEGALATHRLRGRMPIDAHTLRWYYGLVIDPYPMTIRRADGQVMVEDVRGDAWSRTIDVSGQFRAPLLTEKVVGIVLAALLLVPLGIRLGAHARRKRVVRSVRLQPDRDGASSAGP
jgi:hypothetical protein